MGLVSTKRCVSCEATTSDMTARNCVVCGREFPRNELDRLRAENAAQALLIASLKERELALKDSKRQFETDASDRIDTLTQQLSDTQRQNAELKESIAQKNSDISSWVERDFANQRKIADLMQRVDSMRGALEAIKEAVCGEHVGRWDTFDRVYTIRGGLADACDIALSASKVSNEGDGNE